MATGTGNLPNQNMDFVPLATLPAADLDKLVDNIEALATGTGIGDGSVVTAAIKDANVTPAKWTNPYCARAYLGTTQSNITDNTATKVLLDTESFDVNSDYDAANKRYVAPVTGYYQVNASVSFSGAIASKLYIAYIYVNGASVTQLYVANGTDGNAVCSAHLSDTVYIVAGQYVELYAKTLAGANTVDIGAGSAATYMSIHLVSV